MFIFGGDIMIKKQQKLQNIPSPVKNDKWSNFDGLGFIIIKHFGDYLKHFKTFSVQLLYSNHLVSIDAHSSPVQTESK